MSLDFLKPDQPQRPRPAARPGIKREILFFFSADFCLSCSIKQKKCLLAWLGVRWLRYRNSVLHDTPVRLVVRHQLVTVKVLGIRF